jgi:hypothetical protein
MLYSSIWSDYCPGQFIKRRRRYYKEPDWGAIIEKSARYSCFIVSNGVVVVMTLVYILIIITEQRVNKQSGVSFRCPFGGNGKNRKKVIIIA